MTDEAQRIIALEQALFALLAAGAVRGIPPNDLRLHAIGGLLTGARWKWINEAHVGATINELQQAMRVFPD
ncbi:MULTISPECIES: hypothetical protein [Pseudomonas]|uniref:Uncharacterized protein n=1 Tax=Pseudomonas soli TaxID=1306993 RepID=A0A2V4I3I2_9PSED|nr:MULTISPECIES: hypothetical protein [Pseudomonas]PYB84371.1 hypothetical protein DMX07_07530 [Pseudomonas soli]QWA30258.1 hypothetical protein KHO27_05065 [Pseudomonas sp. RC3H12]